MEIGEEFVGVDACIGAAAALEGFGGHDLGDGGEEGGLDGGEGGVFLCLPAVVVGAIEGEG